MKEEPDWMAPPEAGHGLVVGRFDPLHAGHAFVLDFARAYTRTLDVAVLEASEDSYPARLRAAWLREDVPDARVVVVARLEDPAEQAEALRSALGATPDVLVSSRPAQGRLADALGARHVVVDPAHALVPVQSAAVRADPLGHWAWLPPPVRARLARRVVVIGPESVGKTTLAARLAAHFETVWVGEYLRTWIDFKGLPVVQADVSAAAQGQQASEAALARRANRVLFCDTDLWLSALYSEHYYDEAPPWIVEAARAQRRDLYLLLDTDVPWVPDPQRDQPHARDAIRDRLVALLEREDLPFRVIRGDWEERFREAVAAVEALLR